MRHWKTTAAFCMCLTMGMLTVGCGAAASVTEEEMPAEFESAAVDTEKNSVETDEKKETEETLKDTHVFMFKSAENPFGELLYQGFQEYMAEKNEKTVYCTPKEATAQAQILLLEELIAQDVASITFSANGSEGYEDVLKKASDAGIPVITVDSETAPEQTVCHVEQALPADVGAYLIQAAVLIALEIEYPGDGRMEETVKTALEGYSGEEIVLGVLSTSEDSPVQNEWISAMRLELEKDFYSGKVEGKPVLKYGEDESAASKVQVGAFLREDQVDCIIAPTTVGMVAAAEVLSDNQSEVGLTGLGLPSLMQPYMPQAEDADSFAYVCPYMILWDVPHQGAAAAAAVYASVYEGFGGEAGETFEMSAFRDYNHTTYKAYTNGKGTGVLAGVPIVFYKGNTAEWMSVL